MKNLSLLLSPLLWWLLSRLNPGIDTHSRKTLLSKKAFTDWCQANPDLCEVYCGNQYPIYPLPCSCCGDISLVWIGEEGNDHKTGMNPEDREMRFNYWNSDCMPDGACLSCFLEDLEPREMQRRIDDPNDNWFKQGRIELTRTGSVNIYRHGQDVISIDLDSNVSLLS